MSPSSQRKTPLWPHLLCIGLVILVGCRTHAARPAVHTSTVSRSSSPEDLRARPGEITVEQAVESCDHFRNAIGMEPPKLAARIERSMVDGKPSGSYFISYGGHSIVTVDSHTGAVTSFSNMLPLDPQFGAHYNTDAVALARIEALTKSIGLPKELVLIDFHLYGPVGGPDTAKRRKLMWLAPTARFESKPYGYRFQRAPDSVTLHIEPCHGKLKDYGRARAYEYTIESHDAKLTLAKALALAAPIVDKYKLGKWRPGESGYGRPNPLLPPAEPHYLGFVWPNGLFKGLKYDQDLFGPHTLRLAWVLCYPRHDEIWIDAADGRVLGGVCAKTD